MTIRKDIYFIFDSQNFPIFSKFSIFKMTIVSTFLFIIHVSIWALSLFRISVQQWVPLAWFIGLALFMWFLINDPDFGVDQKQEFVEQPSLQMMPFVYPYQNETATMAQNLLYIFWVVFTSVLYSGLNTICPCVSACTLIMFPFLWSLK